MVARRQFSMAFSTQFLIIAVSLLQATISGSTEDAPEISMMKHEESFCAMYGVCGTREDGKPLNCPDSVAAVTPDALLSAKIQSLCPTLSGDICCTAEQFNILRSQVQQAVPFLVGCPACLRNFLNLFCELSCSPDQSLFINVTSVAEGTNSSTVTGIDFFVTEEYGTLLFESCQDVKFGAMNTRAMEFVGGGAKNSQEWFTFIGREAGIYEPGSPFAIRFTSADLNSSMKPLNVSVVPCWDASLSCSCGDCPSASFCSEPLPPTPDDSDHCSVHFGFIQVWCVDLAMVILYVLVVSAMFALFLSTYTWRGETRQSLREPLLHFEEESELHSINDNGLEITNVQVLENEVEGNIGVHKPFIQDLLSRFFRRHGIWVARNPGFILFTSGIFMFLLCLGLLLLRVETDPEKLWVSPGSKAAAEKEFFDTHLAPFYRIEQLILGTVPQAGEEAPSIVTGDNILLLFQMQKKIDALRGNNSGNSVSLSEICMKPFGSACASQTILQYYKMDSQLFEDYEGVSHAHFCFEHFSSSEPCLSAYQAPVDPSTVLGGFSGSNYSQATAFVVTYPVNNAVGKTAKANKAANAWEEAFITLAKEELLQMAISHNLTLAFSSESSIQAELKRESTADVITIVISYLVMFAYISFSLGDFSPSVAPVYVTSKVSLGLAGVGIVAFSVLGSIGLFSFFGVKSTLIIAEVIPFLVLAVGVDNMCIIVHAVKRQDASLSSDVQVGNALAEVGPSITLASLAETLAFAVGIMTPMPACRVFSMFAAAAVFLDYLLQVTAFVALLTFDLKRTKSRRVDCFPCLSCSRPDHQSEHLTGTLERRKEPGLLVWYMQRFHAPFLQMPAVKAIVLAGFTGLAFASIALTTRVSPGLEQQVVLPRDSYLQGYFTNITEYLRIGPPLYFVVQDLNYSLSSNQTDLLCSISQCNSKSLLNEISQASESPESSYIAKPAASWLDDFLVWMSPDAFGCCRKFPNGSYCPPDDQPPCCPEGEDYCGVSETCQDCTTCFLHSELNAGRPNSSQFKEKLPWFLKALPSADCSKGGVGAYSTSVDLNDYENGVIKASEFRTYHTPLNKQSDFINSMKAARTFASHMSESLQMAIFPYSVSYIFFEQYLDIWRTTVVSLILALGAVFGVCLIVTSSLWLSSIIILVLAMIVTDMLGLMSFMDVQLNAISVVNLVMSIGIAVEFCVHLTHSFSILPGDKSERAAKSLITMGASVFSGITITKLVGVLVLFFSRSEIFEVYYFRMYLALVMLGFLHGLVFLPVFLSIFGPPPLCPLSVEMDQSLNGEESKTVHMGMLKVGSEEESGTRDGIH